MIKSLRNKKAQAMLGEYGALILLVIAAIVTMTVYFKRSVQAKIYDARWYMLNDIRNRAGSSFNGLLYAEYEPYYVESSADVSSTIDSADILQQGGTSGIYTKTVDDTRTTNAASTTLPPRDADIIPPAP